MQILLGETSNGFLYQCTCGAVHEKVKLLKGKRIYGNCKECASHRIAGGKSHPLYWIWNNNHKKLWPSFAEFLMELPPWPGEKYMLTGRNGTKASPGNVAWVKKPLTLHPITPEYMRNFREDFYDDALKQLHKEAHLSFFGDEENRTAFMAHLATLEEKGIVPDDTDLEELQISNEKESHHLAVVQSHRSELQQHARGRSSQTWPARGIRLQLAPLLAQRMKEHYTSGMARGTATNLDVVHPLVKYVPWDVMAHIAVTVTLDAVGQGTKFGTPMSQLYMTLGSRLEHQAFYEHVKTENPRAWEKIDRWYLQDTVKGVDSKFQCSKKLVGETSFEFMDNKRKTQLGNWAWANLQSVTNWFTTVLWYEPTSNKTVHFLGLSEDGLKYAATIMAMKDEHSYECWPMIVPPLPWEPDKRGGYLKFHPDTASLVRNNYGTAEKTDPSPTAIAALNHIQSQAFCVNQYIYGVMKRLCAGGTFELGSFRVYEADSYKDTHYPLIDPEVWDLPRENGGVNPQIRAAKRLIKKFHGNQKKAEKQRVPTERLLRAAARFFNAKAFWLPMFMDSRTRMYYMVDTLNPQGADPQKALIKFAKGVPVNAGNREMVRRDLLITLANNWAGKVDGTNIKSDKLPMREREEFARKLIKEHGFEAVKNPCSADGFSFWGAADEPFQFLAALEEYWALFEADASERRYVAQVGNGRDASNSGMQIQGALLKDEKMCLFTNAIDTKVPMDAYEEVARHARAIIKRPGWLDEQLQRCEDNARRNEQKRKDENPKYEMRTEFNFKYRVKPSQITRKVAKRAVMCSGYGASWQSKNEYVSEELDAIAQVLGDKFTLAEKVITTNAIIQGQREAFPRSDEINRWFKAIGKGVLNKSEGNNHYVRWKTAAGSTVVQEYRLRDVHVVNTYGQGGAKYDQRMMDVMGVRNENTNQTHVATETFDKIQETKTQTALAANWTHSQDASIFQVAFKTFKHPFYVVHDCGYCPAGCVDDMVTAMKRAFTFVANSDVLDKLPEMNQIDPPSELQKGDVDATSFLRSKYMFA